MRFLYGSRTCCATIRTMMNGLRQTLIGLPVLRATVLAYYMGIQIFVCISYFLDVLVSRKIYICSTVDKIFYSFY